MMHRSIMIESTIEKKYDFTLMVSTLLLLGWGTVMIYSTSAPFAEMQYQNSHFFLQKHLVHILLGISVLALGLKIDYHLWQKYASWMMLGMLLVLILVLIVLIIYVAAYLERKQEMLSSFFRGLTPNFLVTGFFLFLILLQPDFGSVILIATTVLMMLYVGGGRPLHIFGSLIGMGLIGGFLIASHSYRVKRILAFLNPWEDPLNSGFQIIQSYIALGTGGWFGKGLGESHQKLFFLPDAHTDFIFAVIGEELGFLWVFVLVGIFSLFIWRGFWISWNAPDRFGKYLAFGSTTILSLQIIINLFVVSGLLPTKGLPLPFISYGGSNLLSTLFLTGILLNISHQIIPYQTPPGKQ